MKQQHFERQYQAAWQAFAQQLQGLEAKQKTSVNAPSFAAHYRQICQHLALAQARNYSPQLIDQLQHLALRGHQQFYRHRSHIGGQIIAFILQGFAREVRKNWPTVTVASSVFFISLLAMGGLTYLFPELIYSLQSPERVGEMERMYAPSTEKIGQLPERNASSDWMMFGYYILNNVGIAFQTFASGLLAGVGSLFFLLFNGLSIGAVAGYLTQAGLAETFWSFVVGHGAFELTGIALAGAAGLKLGWALLAPGQLPRTEALRLAARDAVKLISGVFIFLLIAAFIEAFWSSTSSVSPWIKYTVGAVLWLLVLSYLVFAGRAQHAPD